MALKSRLSARPGQRLALTPALRMGLDVLQLPALDLVDKLRDEAARNPLLVLEERAPFGSNEDVASLDHGALAAVAEPSLADHVKSQLSLLGLSPATLAMAHYLADDLDERGFLDRSPAEIAVSVQQPLALVQAGIEALHRCDPPGLGARTLMECLELQLMEHGLARSRARQVVAALDPLLQGTLDVASAALGTTLAETEALADLARSLDPNPGAQIAASRPQLLVPELRVLFGPDGQPQVELVETWMPSLRVDEALLEHSQQSKEGRAFAAAHVAGAHALIRAVRFRGDTLLRIGRAMVEAQAAYITRQCDAPKPLARQALAGLLGLHPSTIGRAIRGRAIEIRGNVIDLEWFFPSAVDGSGVLSDAAVRRRIAALIADETWPNILSDARIVALLAEQGVDIARRTVAKYRQCMSIPSSRIRRRTANQAASRTRAVPLRRPGAW